MPSWARRVVVIAGYVLATVLLLVAIPILVPALWIVDRTMGPPTALARTAVFLGVYLVCETVGLVASAILWRPRAMRGRAFLAAHRRLQTWWARTLFRAASSLFGFRVEARGLENVAPGPVLVFMRHASLADTLLPAVLLADHMDLRYVLKRELLWDPCLDVVGHRLPNVFVARDGADSDGEAARVAALAVGIGSREGVLIYPEGTRFSPEKLRRALTIVEERAPDRAPRIRRFAHVLPPRLGGVLALLRAAPEADVVVVAHAGFDVLRTAGDLWRGRLRDRLIRVWAWRIARRDVPLDDAARASWLDATWAEVDAWVGAEQS